MIVGIDLGTTNSLIGAYTDAGPVLFQSPLGDMLTPSVVSLDDDNGILIGQGARDRLITHADRSIATFKRWMGISGNNCLTAQLSGMLWNKEKLQK